MPIDEISLKLLMDSKWIQNHNGFLKNRLTLLYGAFDKLSLTLFHRKRNDVNVYLMLKY